MQKFRLLPERLAKWERERKGLRRRMFGLMGLSAPVAIAAPAAAWEPMEVGFASVDRGPTSLVYLLRAPLTLGMLRRVGKCLPAEPKRRLVMVSETFVEDVRRLPNLIPAEWYAKKGKSLIPGSLGKVEWFHIVVDPTLKKNEWAMELMDTSGYVKSGEQS